MRNVAIYAPTATAISLDKLQQLAGDAKVSTPNREASLRIDWADVSVTINTMPAPEIPRHLEGFCGYVQHLAGQSNQQVTNLLERIRGVQFVHGIMIEPDLDPDGKAERLINGLLEHYRALLFTNHAVYDEHGQRLIGPPAPPPDESANWQPSEAQLARVNRSKNLLAERKVPIYNGPLYIEDDDEVTLREAKEVERRVLVLWVVAMKGEQMPHQEGLALVKRFGVEDAITPSEQEFLHNPSPDPNECQKMVWRLESVWVLMWALGYIDELGWPDKFSDVPRLVKLLRPHQTSPGFIGTAKLRPKAEILDATDLTMRQHWAIRDAYLAKKPIPANFNWAKPTAMVPINACAPTGILEERHRALNWLVRYGDADWDDVDTPT
jgi:hypothetical protein